MIPAIHYPMEFLNSLEIPNFINIININLTKYTKFDFVYLRKSSFAAFWSYNLYCRNLAFASGSLTPLHHLCLTVDGGCNILHRIIYNFWRPPKLAPFPESLASVSRVLLWSFCCHSQTSCNVTFLSFSRRVSGERPTSQYLDFKSTVV